MWYDCSQLPQSMSKHQRPSAPKRNQTQKPSVIDNDKPKRLSVAVAKINVEFWDTDSNNKNGTDSNYDLSNFVSDSSDPNNYYL